MSMFASRNRFQLLALVAIIALFASLFVGCSSDSHQTSSSSTNSSSSSSAVPLAGGWTAAEYADATIPQNAQAAFDKALEGYVGLSLKPIALIGTQVVAGTNYLFLCEGSPVVQNPKSKLYLVKVYEDLNGNAEITSAEPFDPLSQPGN